MQYYETRDDLLNFLNKNIIVAEIGVFKGEFSEKIKYTLNPKELHLIDLFTGPMCSGDKDGRNIETIQLDPFYENLKNKYSHDASVFIKKGRSAEVLNEYSDNYFDFIYIDADHSYGGVKTDLALSLRKIKKDGFVGGHDLNQSWFPGVVQAVSEFCNATKNEIVCLSKDALPSFLIEIKNK